jgi:peptidoglycan/LPS O-acetylase OafA/YrhL
LLPDSAPGTTLGDRLRAAGRGLKVFYVRRALRILPMAYAVALVFFLIIALLRIDTEVVVKGHIPGVTRAYRVNIDTITTEIIAVLTFTYNYVITRQPFQILVPYWSLSVEEHFYLFLPLCYALLANDKNRLCFALCGVLFIAFIARPFEPFPNWSEEYQRFASHRLFDYLFAGVALALLRKAGVGSKLLRRRGPGFTIAMNLLALALLVGQWIEPGIDPHAHVSNFTHFFLLINSVALVFLASAGHDYVLGLRGCRRVLEYLGSRSYGIYLIHWFVNCLAALFRPQIAQLPGATTFLGKLLLLALLFGISLAITELCFRFIERPLIDYGLRLTSRRHDR